MGDTFRRNDIANERQNDRGPQPYKDAHEALSQTQAQIKSEAVADIEQHLHETDEEREERHLNEAQQRLAEVAREVRDEQQAHDQ